MANKDNAVLNFTHQEIAELLMEVKLGEVLPAGVDADELVADVAANKATVAAHEEAIAEKANKKDMEDAMALKADANKIEAAQKADKEELKNQMAADKKAMEDAIAAAKEEMQAAMVVMQNRIAELEAAKKTVRKKAVKA